MKVVEYVGVTDNGEQILCNGNPNKGLVYHLSGLNEILSFGNLLRVRNRTTCVYCCNEWNKQLDSSCKHLRVHPVKMSFEANIIVDKRCNRVANAVKESEEKK